MQQLLSFVLLDVRAGGTELREVANSEYKD
jgi:hypothetical protein